MKFVICNGEVFFVVIYFNGEFYFWKIDGIVFGMWRFWWFDVFMIDIFLNFIVVGDWFFFLVIFVDIGNELWLIDGIVVGMNLV